LASRNELASWVSREGGFLISSALFLVAGLAVLLGTVFPVFVRMFTGNTVNVTSSFFNQVDVPLFVVLVLIMGICPFLLSKGTLLRELGLRLAAPFGAALVLAIVLGVLHIGAWYVVVAFAVCLFVLVAMALEWTRGIRGRRRAHREYVVVAFGRMVWSNRQRYGGYVIHLGILLVTIGVLGSTAFKVEREASLKLGQSMTVGSYQLTYDDLRQTTNGKEDVVTAKLSVYQNGSFTDVLFPQKIFHVSYEQPVTEVAIRSTVLEDLYVILSGWEQERTISLKVVINPLVMWLWIGGGVLLAGAVIALWPRRKSALDETEGSQ
jgi:cytochrome c-type biogenesis protein CcmF